MMNCKIKASVPLCVTPEGNGFITSANFQLTLYEKGGKKDLFIETLFYQNHKTMSVKFFFN